jgi:CheY-like chemotaxis protein
MFNILVAEDDRNFGSVLKLEFEECKYHVDLVPDGVEAVLSFLITDYDFILLDIRMPRLNGNDALKIIKKINPHVPAITFSGHAGREEMEESIRCGAIKCLRKPFELAQLKEDMENFVLQ